MDQSRPPVAPTQDDTLFMVEAYRSTAPIGDPASVEDDPATIVGVIDIPHDEVILYLVHARDGRTAERLIRGRGGRPIRVVDVRWSPDTG